MTTDLTAEHAAERRAAARLLLVHPLMTPRSQPEGFRLVRRHAEHLTRMFNQQFGYRLVVEPGFARLHKAGLGHDAGHRLERRSGAPFTPRTYACLALALSALVTAPEQLLLSDFVVRIRTAAAEAGIDLTDASPAALKRTLTAVFTQLLAWEILTENEGTVESYATDDQAEALLTVDREIARRMVSGPLGRAGSAEELVAMAEAPGPGGPRHLVRRRLVETPVVYLDDLTDTERAWLRQQQRREQRALEDVLGLDTEIRAEGVAVIDPEGELSDIDFPLGGRTVHHAALLLVQRLVARLRPSDAGHPASGGRLVVGVPVPDGLIEAELAGLAAEHRTIWAGQYTQAPPLLRDAVTDVLRRMRLLAPADPPRAARDPGAASADRQVTDVSGARGDAAVAGAQWVLLAAAARYGPAAGDSPLRPRRRMEAGS